MAPNKPNTKITEEPLELICGREMASLHQAAKDGQLDECRRLVEKEGKDVNERDEVSVWLFVYLFASPSIHQHSDRSTQVRLFLVSAAPTLSFVAGW
jgi:hypothetical protein